MRGLRRIVKVTFKGVDVTDIVCSVVEYEIPPHELHLTSSIWFSGIEYKVQKRLCITEEEYMKTPFTLHLDDGRTKNKHSYDIHDPSVKCWIGVNRDNKLVGI